MEVVQVLRMNEGEGKASYNSNSSIQKQGMLKAKPLLDQSIAELYSKNLPECIRMADLGCSSGPNTLQLVQHTIETVDSVCRNLNRKAPTFQVFLNDLHGNDFNTIFRSLPSFYQQLRLENRRQPDTCFIAAMPGSFYGRLFPDDFLHFVHSSYSLHWRSQVPEGLLSKLGVPLNKGNIYVTKTSPSSVAKAYLDSFERDITSFLRSRSAEMVSGGLLVITLVGSKRKPNKYKVTVWELLGIAIYEMVLEGLIEESKLDSFDLPYYAPTMEEVKEVIEKEGSFSFQREEVFKVDWDAKGTKVDGFKCTKGRRVAMNIRAVAESIIASHFGGEMMDSLFDRFGVKVDEYLMKNEGNCLTMVISMTKN